MNFALEQQYAIHNYLARRHSGYWLRIQSRLQAANSQTRATSFTCRTHLDDAHGVVQDAARVGDVVADGKREPREMRLEEQVGLGVWVVHGPRVNLPRHLRDTTAAAARKAVNGPIDLRP